MTEQKKFMGTIGWIKGNLMTSSQSKDKYDNNNFIPGGSNIPDSEPTRPDGIPPVTDGLILCYDGNNNGGNRVGNMWGASWRELTTNTEGYVSTQGDTKTPALTNASGEKCYQKWFTDEYGTYCFLDSVETRGIVSSIDLPNAEHTFIMLVKKKDDYSFITPCSMVNHKNIWSQWEFPNPSRTYEDGSNAGYYRVSYTGKDQGGNTQSCNWLVDGQNMDRNKPALISNITKYLGNNSFQTETWLNNKCNRMSPMTSNPVGGAFTGKIRFGGDISGSTTSYKCERYIYACYFYNRALTEVEYTKVKSYISKRYNLDL